MIKLFYVALVVAFFNLIFVQMKIKYKVLSSSTMANLVLLNQLNYSDANAIIFDGNSLCNAI
jgi:hypothetical protein